jgi:hypothetical protein
MKCNYFVFPPKSEKREVTWMETLITLLGVGGGVLSVASVVSIFSTPGAVDRSSGVDFGAVSPACGGGWDDFDTPSPPEGGITEELVWFDKLEFEKLDLEDGETIPFVTMSCFSTTILLDALVVVKLMP